MTESKARADGKKRGGGNPIAEWGAAAVGLVLLVGSVAFSVHRAIRHGDSPPDIVVTLTAIKPIGRGYVMEFAAENRGSTPAAGVRIEGRVSGAGGAAEMADVTLDYLPAGARQDGGLFVQSDPRIGTVVLRAVGYHKP